MNHYMIATCPRTSSAKELDAEIQSPPTDCLEVHRLQFGETCSYFGTGAVMEPEGNIRFRSGPTCWGFLV